MATTDPILRITDGTDTVDLIDPTSGFHLDSWRPRSPGYKGGGVFQSSPILEGSRLVHAVLDDAEETMRIKARAGSPDTVIADFVKLRRLLRRATEYWVEEWSGDFVYLEARGAGETNTRYAIISLGAVPDDENPYAQPFLQGDGGAVMDDIVLNFRRGQWLSHAPGTAGDIQASAQDTFGGTETTETEAVDGNNDDVWNPWDQRQVIIISQNVLAVGNGAGVVNGSLRSGVKFDNVNVPQGAEILYAKITFVAESTLSDKGCYTLISGIDEDNASDFAAPIPENLFARDLTDAYQTWPEAQDSEGIEATTAGNSYETPNIAHIVQELVDRAGWAANNSMAFVIDDNGSDTDIYRLWAAHNHATLDPPELEIIYATPTTYGRAATTEREVYVASKRNKANLSHAYHHDDSLGTWSSNLQEAALPFNLLPASPTTSDLLVMGVSTAFEDQGPFSSVVFDLGTTIDTSDAGRVEWQYWDGASWSQLEIQDNTDRQGDAYYKALNSSGVNSLHFVPPSDWATLNLNSHFGGSAPNVTGWWIRGIVQDGAVTSPTQQNRILYSITWPYVDIDEAQLSGDMSALIRFHLQNPADGQFSNDPKRWINRLLISSRSNSRGTNFSPYLNFANVQNPDGIRCMDVNGAFAADNTAAAGTLWQHTSGVHTLERAVYFVMNEVISSEYLGRYHAFLRAKQVGGSAGDFGVQLYRSWGLTDVAVSDVIRLRTTGEIELIDLGPVSLPGTALATPADQTYSVLSIFTVNDGAGADLYLYDLILMPTDEWIGDFTDLNNDVRTVLGRVFLTDATYLEIDNVVNPRFPVRAPVRRVSNNWIWANWFPIINAPPNLKEGKDQRLFFLAARYANKNTGASEVILSEPEMALRISLQAVNRYHTMRGSG